MNEDRDRGPDKRERLVEGFARQVIAALASVRLAIALLIIILACCIMGVTVFRDAQAWEFIFSTLWFNGLLVLLVANIGFCFFGRIWGRRVTLISFGMILFHLSFIAMFLGIIFNSMFYFRGMMRLTEGESLPNGDIRSYDYAEQGRFFDMARFRGETTLIKMHTGYQVDGADKRSAYEIEVGQGSDAKRDVIFITKKLVYKGFQFFNDREGYAILIKLHDRSRKELYGAYVPFQSLKQKDGAYLYTTGTRDGPGSFPYPQDPLKPLYALQVTYIPSPLKERSGEAVFQAWPLHDGSPRAGDKHLAEGKVPIGKQFRVGDHFVSAAEVRYWVMMSVRHEPGKPIVLTSLWVGLGGMIITFIGRMVRTSN